MSCLPSFVLPPWRKTRLSWTSALTWVSNFAMSIHFHVLVSSAGKGIILWSTRLGIQTTHKMWDSMTSLMTNLQFIAEWWHRTGMFNGQLLSCYIAGTLLASCISHVFQPGSLARRPKDLRNKITWYNLVLARCFDPPASDGTILSTAGGKNLNDHYITPLSDTPMH